MDKNKPPGISFDDVILSELTFSRKEALSSKLPLDMKLNSKISFSQKEEKLAYELSCQIRDVEDCFNIRCTMVGLFSIIKGQENMGLEEYSKLSAPAAIFPYIRETIAATTLKAGIPPVIIPPANLSLLKQAGSKSTSSDS